MLWKISNPVLETRYSDASGTSTGAYKATKSRWAVAEVGRVFEGMGQHNPARGKEPCFVHSTKELRVQEIAVRLFTP